MTLKENIEKNRMGNAHVYVLLVRFSKMFNWEIRLKNAHVGYGNQVLKINSIHTYSYDLWLKVCEHIIFGDLLHPFDKDFCICYFIIFWWIIFFKNQSIYILIHVPRILSYKSNYENKSIQTADVTQIWKYVDTDRMWRNYENMSIQTGWDAIMKICRYRQDVTQLWKYVDTDRMWRNY